jgi:hypothetical protein
MASFAELRKKALGYVANPVTYLTDPSNFWVVEFTQTNANRYGIGSIQRAGFCPGDYLTTPECVKLFKTIKALMYSELNVIEDATGFCDMAHVFESKPANDTWILHSNCRISVSSPWPIGRGAFVALFCVQNAIDEMKANPDKIVFVEPLDEFKNAGNWLGDDLHEYVKVLAPRANKKLSRRRLRLFSGQFKHNGVDVHSIRPTEQFTPPIRHVAETFYNARPELDISFKDWEDDVRVNILFFTRLAYEEAYRTRTMYTEIISLGQYNFTKYFISNYDVIALLQEDQLNDQMMNMLMQPQGTDNSVKHVKDHFMYEPRLWQMVKSNLLPETKIQRLGHRPRGEHHDESSASKRSRRDADEAKDAEE